MVCHRSKNYGGKSVASRQNRPPQPLKNAEFSRKVTPPSPHAPCVICPIVYRNHTDLISTQNPKDFNDLSELTQPYITMRTHAESNKTYVMVANRWQCHPYNPAPPIYNKEDHHEENRRNVPQLHQGKRTGF